MPHHHTPTTPTRLVTLLTLAILAILLAACGAERQMIARYQALQKLPQDVTTLLQLNRCIL